MSYQNIDRSKKCELLAPAGGVKSFIAAVENGADAVYVGGPKFSARAHADNFTDDDMVRALDYAHKRGVRVHVTMNTLLRDDELSAAVRYAAFLYEHGVDALIVQDLGLAYRIRRVMPDLPLHLSTQATVCTPEAVRAAAELGFSRVVLAREVSDRELEEIAKDAPVELEVFVHGALCICYSGQCQLSRYIGGRSGNRGSCAQPCRLPYETFSGSGKRLDGAPACPLSPKDLCRIDQLGDLARLGIASLKIEGRMKSPEYVAVVTSIYRKYLDLLYRDGSYIVSREDREKLRQIYSRGSFTGGYRDGDPGRALMSGDVPKHQGIRVGTVLGAGGRSLVDVKLTGELSQGDGVEICGRSRAGNVVTYYKELSGGKDEGEKKNRSRHAGRGRKPAASAASAASASSSAPAAPTAKTSSAPASSAASAAPTAAAAAALSAPRTVRVGDIRERVYPGDPVFRMSSGKQLEEARETFRDITFESGKFHRQMPVRMTLTGTDGVLTLRCEAETGDAAVATSGTYPRDPDHPASEERMRSSLKKSGGTPFAVTEVRLEGDLDVRVRAAELNRLRRTALEKLEAALIVRRDPPDLSREEPIPAPPDIPREMPEERYFFTWESYREFRWDPDDPASGGKPAAVVPAAALAMHADEFDPKDPRFCCVIPSVGNVSKGEEDRLIRKHFDRIAGWAEETGIYLGNLTWLDAFRSRGIRLFADYGLNVTNHSARQALREIGIEEGAPSLELAGDAFL